MYFKKVIIFPEPFMKDDEIYVMYHNGLWFSRRKGEQFNFLRTYKTPLVNSTNLKLVNNIFNCYTKQNLYLFCECFL